MDFVIDGNTSIYDITVINCNFIYDMDNVSEYPFFIIKINSDYPIVLPLSFTNEDFKQKQLVKYPRHKFPNPSCRQDQTNIQRLMFRLGENNKEVIFKYDFKLLKKILNIEYNDYTYSQLIEYLKSSDFIVESKDNINIFKTKTKLLEKLIDYFNIGKSILEIEETDYLEPYDSRKRQAHYNFIKIKLLTKYNSTKIYYKIFYDILDVKNNDEEYKIIEFGENIRHETNSKTKKYCILQKINNEINKINLIQLDNLD